MGCDIHAFVEYFSKQESTKNDSCFVDCFADELSFGRDYVLFGLLAGVRHNCSVIVMPRGVPKDPHMSFSANRRYFLDVVDDTDTSRVVYRTNSITRSEADEYVSKGVSRYVDTGRTKIVEPGFHTPTWLTLDELIEIRKLYLIEIVQHYSDLSSKARKDLVEFLRNKDAKILMKYAFPPHDNNKFYATLCTMQALERSSETEDVTTRLVCWFDS